MAYLTQPEEREEGKGCGAPQKALLYKGARQLTTLPPPGKHFRVVDRPITHAKELSYAAVKEALAVPARDTVCRRRRPHKRHGTVGYQ